MSSQPSRLMAPRFSFVDSGLPRDLYAVESIDKEIIAATCPENDSISRL
jgi:hypothetical protein